MKVWFVVPVHERVQLARVCLAQLARTCDVMRDAGMRADAVVLGSDKRLLTAARDLGFGTVTCENQPLGRKWNHGFQLACDPRFNPDPVDYVIPFGSDDWVDPQLLLSAPWPKKDEITSFTRGAVVSEDGRKLTRLRIRYAGGWGIRIIPTELIARAGYRPSSESARFAIDGSTLRGIMAGGPRGRREPRRLEYDLHDLQLIDWKTTGAQLNSYRACLRYRHAPEQEIDWDELAQVYPADALATVRRLYHRATVRRSKAQGGNGGPTGSGTPPEARTEQARRQEVEA